MKKIILATVALVAVSGAAFAGSDNYNNSGVNQPAPAVDTTRTSSIKSDSPVYKLLNSGDAQKSAPQGADRDHFGR
ncbi:DUF680 domain-containing protein [Mesorhizobium sp. CU2]|uniref:DUF680 domain-containing protein n=1 Tax=unclassified Mesorhizobium TaxID=325217 RepID=UPI00112EAA67|nr:MULTISPECIES: DUF680 domain-containing protein [unclassified Mesorhizobium]TPN89916.1 DUF680 domain-containing protein [Mesorhizobium sp. CU3]TPO21463.1 DUF680 domain-containing protein [Mesorhizobium sp. CU2]